MLHSNLGGMVETTAAIITATFYPDYNGRTEKIESICDAIYELSEYKASDSKLKNPYLLIGEDKSRECYHSGCFRTYDRHSILRYKMCDTHTKRAHVQITYNEFYYLVKAVRRYNEMTVRTNGGRVDSALMISMYLYFKNHILLNVSKNQDAYISIDTLAKLFRASTHTVEKYQDILKKIGLINIKRGSFSSGKANVLSLAYTWEKYFNGTNLTLWFDRDLFSVSPFEDIQHFSACCRAAKTWFRLNPDELSKLPPEKYESYGNNLYKSKEYFDYVAEFEIPAEYADEVKGINAILSTALEAYNEIERQKKELDDIFAEMLLDI